MTDSICRPRIEALLHLCIGLFVFGTASLVMGLVGVGTPAVAGYEVSGGLFYTAASASVVLSLGGIQFLGNITSNDSGL